MTITLKQKLLKGSFWNALSQFSSQGINFVLLIVLARLLSPEDFGLLGMVSIYTGLLSYFSECGLVASIIKKNKINELDYNTAFWGGLIFAAVVAVIIFLSAPLISWFYNEPRLTAIARAMSLVIIIGAYSFVPTAIEQKKLEYKKLSIIQLFSQLFSGIIAIILAFQGAGVWALVYQQISMHIFAQLGYFFWIRWKPCFQFSIKSFKELFGFGMHITANNLIKFFSENIDYILVGKILGPNALGIYTMAFRLSRYPIEKMGPIFGRMLFPAFASIQNSPDRIRINVLRISAIIPLITIPFLVFLFFTTQSIIKLTVGEKWLGVVPIIKIFILYVSVLSFSFADEPVLMVIGKIKELNIVKLLMSLLILACGYFAVTVFGIMGMAILYTIILTIYYIILKAMTLNAIKIRYKEYVLAIRKTGICISIVFCLALINWLLLPQNDSIYIISIGISIVAAVIISTCLLKILTIKPFGVNLNGFTK